MMKRLRNERGVALVTAIMLSLLALVIILVLLYIIGQGTKLSASSKRYKSALEASYGGAEVFTKEIIPQLMGSGTASLAVVLAGSAPTMGDVACLSGVGGVGGKLNSIPANWTYCSASAKTVNPKDTYDAKFTLQGQPGQPNFNVFAKIVDSQPGNSDTSGMSDQLDSGSGVAYGAAGVSPKHIPATYRIEIQGERATNPLEKANLSVLYAY